MRRRLVPPPSLLTAFQATLSELRGTLTGQRPRMTFEVHYGANRFQFYDSPKAKQELGYNPRGY